MTLKTLAALTVAAAFCFAPLAAHAHAGHSHAPKAKKVKKTKAQKKTGVEIRFVVRPTAA